MAQARFRSFQVWLLISRTRKKSYGWHCRASTLAISAVIFATSPSLAQQTPGLRGQIGEEQVYRALLDKSITEEPPEEDTGLQPTEYEPVSEGADVPETDRRDGEAISIFDLNQDNPFGDDRPSVDRPRRREAANGSVRERPATARERIEEARSNRRRPADGTDTADDGGEITTGTIRQERIDALDDGGNEAAGSFQERASAIEGLDREQEDNPYDALGIRTGTFILFPEIEQGLTWSSNADTSSGGDEAVLSETTLRLNAQSDWSRHQARIEAYGTFRKSLSGADISEPSGGVSADLRLDLINGFVATAAAGYSVTPETATSAVVVPGTVSQPLLHALDGSLGLSREEGKVRLAATARAARLIYGDAELSGGGTLSQRERNSTLATLTLRTGYEISPALVPFVEGEIGRRVMDLRVDTAGYARSADRYALRAGIELDLGEKLSGEFAAGWVSERPEDSRLEPIEGVSALASLAWSPSRRTTVNLDASTTIETTTQAGASGSILYDSNLGIEHQLRQNLTGNVSAGLGYRDFSGTSDRDLIIDIEAGLTWWLNRNFGVTSRASYEIVDSNVAGRDAESVSVFLGVKLRR